MSYPMLVEAEKPSRAASLSGDRTRLSLLSDLAVYVTHQRLVPVY